MEHVDQLGLTELKARDASFPKGKKMCRGKLGTIGIDRIKLIVPYGRKQALVLNRSRR